METKCFATRNWFRFDESGYINDCKTCPLFCGLYAEDKTCVVESIDAIMGLVNNQFNGLKQVLIERRKEIERDGK